MRAHVSACVCDLIRRGLMQMKMKLDSDSEDQGYPVDII